MGWSGREGGGVETWLVSHRQISSFFQTGTSCLGCAPLRESRYLLHFLAPQISFCRSVKRSLSFSLPELSRPWRFFPPLCAKKHIMSDSKSPAHTGCRSGWGASWRDKGPCLDKVSPHWRCLTQCSSFSQHTYFFPLSFFLPAFLRKIPGQLYRR